MDPAGNIVKTAARSFPTLLECISDAMKNGYSLVVAGPAPARHDSCDD
jgi:hypothetical protein